MAKSQATTDEQNVQTNQTKRNNMTSAVAPLFCIAKNLKFSQL